MKDWKYIAYLVILAVLLIALMLSKTKQYDWRVTFYHDDKIPYGAYAFDQLMPQIVGNPVQHSFKTVYELKDSLTETHNALFVCTTFSPGKEDTDALLTFVHKGGQAFIAANYFYGPFADTLGLRTRDSFFQNGIFNRRDTTYLHFVNSKSDTTLRFAYKQGNVHNYLFKADSVKAMVINRNEYNQPVAVRFNWGKGSVVVSCAPMAFTNYHLLDNNNYKLAEGLLTYLPPQPTIWFQYYHLGRLEAGTPLRFVLLNDNLRWAYYLSIVALLLFMVFEAKRKQRIIPIVKPLHNTTLEFVGTIGNLYFEKGDHKNIAEKKIQFFLEHVRTAYFMNTHQRDDRFIDQLARKAGVADKTVRSLVHAINRVLEQPKISAQQLTILNQLIEDFYNKK
ncbi:MAG: DUF4350 domain-containing protein [Cyclobacteriaceae bacterium]|nr:DUF4350 domain-containing protein [Cyclobacteriaceae bacterium]